LLAGQGGVRRYCKFYAGLKDGLLDFAAYELEMTAPQGAGGSLRENLISIWDQTGVKPEELKDVECPDSIKYVWGYFIELHNSRGTGAMAPNPISYQDILAWVQLTDKELTPFEIDCLTSLDSLWLSNLKE
jgi:hypothetical protein